ncbi:hypothetical protein B0J15DRAFT_247351 [Fusarium solani]|uniref:Uncharacterized protein n=1 Tax=Fusarium solani TaxID=169388 RepID=A0A9P9KQ37_FUSSL|nr:uncharacterized protein B0J15DRAFT_247351 [Fusarium solani]KAH7266432.1 hypothetical protein B0J15DRAFT_247351 [Fusarium solani]
MRMGAYIYTYICTCIHRLLACCLAAPRWPIPPSNPVFNPIGQTVEFLRIACGDACRLAGALMQRLLQSIIIHADDCQGVKVSKSRNSQCQPGSPGRWAPSRPSDMPRSLELITWRRHLCPCLQLLAEPRGTRTLWPWSAMGLTHLVRLALTMLQLATQLATVVPDV